MNFFEKCCVLLVQGSCSKCVLVHHNGSERQLALPNVNSVCPDLGLSIQDVNRKSALLGEKEKYFKITQQKVNPSVP